MHGKPNNSCARRPQAGFRQASAEAGCSRSSVEGGFCLEAGLAAARELLAVHPDLDAHLRGLRPDRDGRAGGARRARPAGADDVALVGFDDSVLASVRHAGDDRVRQPVEHIAAMATRALLAGEIGAANDWQRIVPTSLTVRRSTAA